MGLLAAVELVKDRDTREKFPKEAELSKKMGPLMNKHGLLGRGGDVISIAPPLCITKDEVDHLDRQVDEIIGEVEEVLKPLRLLAGSEDGPSAPSPATGNAEGPSAFQDDQRPHRAKNCSRRLMAAASGWAGGFQFSDGECRVLRVRPFGECDPELNCPAVSENRERHLVSGLVGVEVADHVLNGADRNTVDRGNHVPGCGVSQRPKGDQAGPLGGAVREHTGDVDS